MRNKFKRYTLILTIISLLLFPMRTFAEGASQTIYSVDTSNKQVALVFDDSNAHVLEILQILSENEVKATFFVIGSEVEKNPDWIKEIASQGHAIGNHTYSHSHSTQITAEQLKIELEKTDEIVKKYTGHSTAPFFQPPYGDYDSSVLQTLGEAGYSKTICWTIPSPDWSGISASQINQQVIDNIVPGAIIVLHANPGAVNTPSALPEMITWLKSEGYAFVTVPQLLDNSAAETKETAAQEEIPPDSITTGSQYKKPDPMSWRIYRLCTLFESRE